MSRILVVEDDIQIARALLVNLRARAYEVEHAATGAQALDLAARHRPDAILLDLGLPDMDGVAVVTGLRGWTTTPILVVSARQESASKVAALDAGADDYVTKPFAMDELLARLRAALRRTATEHPAEQSVVRSRDGRLEIDLTTSTVRVAGEAVRLTPIEWAIVEHFARNPERLIGQAELLRTVWGPEYEGERGYLRVYLSQLRQKLERESSRPEHFQTELGMGYRFLP